MISKQLSQRKKEKALQIFIEIPKKKSKTKKQNPQYLASSKKLQGMLEAGKYYLWRGENSINWNWPQNYIMIGLVGKNIKNIIIIYAFHMSMKLQKKVNKLHRGMEWDKEKKKKKCVCVYQTARDANYSAWNKYPEDN